MGIITSRPSDYNRDFNQNKEVDLAQASSLYVKIALCKNWGRSCRKLCARNVYAWLITPSSADRDARDRGGC